MGKSTVARGRWRSVVVDRTTPWRAALEKLRFSTIAPLQTDVHPALLASDWQGCTASHPHPCRRKSIEQWRSYGCQRSLQPSFSSAHSIVEQTICPTSIVAQTCGCSSATYTRWSGQLKGSRPMGSSGAAFRMELGHLLESPSLACSTRGPRYVPRGLGSSEA